jgi:RNA polymerase sigma-70 factor (ECF subfamily)
VNLSPEALVEAHLDAVHGYALALCRQKDLAEDAVQRAFLKAFQKVHTLQDPLAARAWLLTILRNELAMEWRGRSRLVALEEPEWAELPGEAAEESDIDPALLAELPKALERLSESAREILLLRYQQELSYEQIAALLEVPLGTVQSRIHRAKLALRTQLAPVGGGRP